MMKRKRQRLGELLVEKGRITEQQLEAALEKQRQTGRRLGESLIELGCVKEWEIVDALEEQLGISRVDFMQIQIDRTAAISIPVSLAERYKLIPVACHEGRLRVAMADPTNFFAIDDVRMASGYEIEPALAAESDILRAIQQCYGVTELVEKAVSQLKREEPSLPEAAKFQMADDAPIISIVNSLISQAIRETVSDIHIERTEDAVRVRFRADGILHDVATFPMHTHAAIVSRIKIISGMNIAERRVPQDGRIKVKEQGREIDIRTSTLPTIRGEKVVLRILDQKAVILDVAQLGFSDDNLRRYRKLYAQSYGMILVTGPTGSGKTTTLYSTLTELNDPGCNIITVEDPVEYLLAGINQVQVNVKAGMSFASGLRSILRQDPNIIMVGEVRDGETADIAVRAAMTGHLVLSTLHTNDAVGAIARLIDMEVEPFLIASSLLGVVAQRLVRVICQECREEYILPEHGLERAFLSRLGIEERRFYKGRGCARCNHSGFRGRMAIHEVMPLSAALREKVCRGATGHEVAAFALQDGMISMLRDGIDKACQGKTTVSEVMRVAYIEV
ncbi:GspE/PulE family protein [Azotosporobacter soli]|uniref:GspE/PulE family protein n=1 Tax=Azotosporobacter soli TaxID=3055040 RepID=UPI0031FEA449